MLYLALDKNLQRKLREEVFAAGADARTPQLQDRFKCPQVLSFLEETLRYNPMMVFNAPHFAIEDTTIAGHFIPKGTQVAEYIK